MLERRIATVSISSIILTIASLVLTLVLKRCDGSITTWALNDLVFSPHINLFAASQPIFFSFSRFLYNTHFITQLMMVFRIFVEECSPESRGRVSSIQHTNI